MKMKKKQNGMYSLLAVIALMLAASIYASCSSDDDAWDSSSLGELGTMADGTLDRSGESGGTVYFVGMYIPANAATFTRIPLMNEEYEADISFFWNRGYTGNIYGPYCNPYVNLTPYEDPDSIHMNDSLFVITYQSANLQWNQYNELMLTYNYAAKYKDSISGHVYIYNRKYRRNFSYSELLEHCFVDDEDNN